MVRLNKGLTFIEVILSVSILALAIVPIINWIPLTMETRRKAQRRTTAVFLAQGKMEELRNRILRSFNQVYREDNRNFPAPYSGYFYNITDDRGSRMKLITVKVWYAQEPQYAFTLYNRITKR